MTDFQPSVAAHWDIEANAQLQARPATIEGLLSEEAIAQAQAFNLGLRPLSTPDIARIWSLITGVQFFNTHRSMGGRRLALIDGLSHIGKTTGVLALGMKQHRAALACADPNQPPPRPWIYVLASAQGRGRALTQSMLSFLGVPYGSRETAATLVERLAALAPRIGVHTIFVDDVHFMKGAGVQERFEIANVLKHLVSTVPVTFVLAGVNLAASPMFTRSSTGMMPSDQLDSRADRLVLKAWPKTSSDGEVSPTWIRLLANLAEQIYLPSGPTQWQLNRAKAVRYLIDGSSRRPGTAIEWTIRAANHAIGCNRPLDYQALRATAP